MGAATKNASSNQTKIYLKAGFSHPSTKSYAEYKGSGKLVEDANELTQVNSISGLGQSANTSEFTIYGQNAKLKVALAPSIEDLAVDFLMDRSNTLQKAILDTWDIDDPITVAIDIVSSATNASMYVVNCKFASRTPGFQPDQPGQPNITLAAEAEGIWYDKA